jgi:CrcB protein
LATLLWICLGGALGTAARYGMQTWAKQAFGGAFPWGTLAVNVIGSFFIGAVMYVALNTHVITETVRLTLVTGILGGFTTYSSFNYETLQLYQERSAGLAATYAGGTLLGCWLAGAMGLLVGKRLVGG